MTLDLGNDSEPLLTVEQVAVLLNVEEGTVRQWVKLKRIPVVKLGNKLTRFRPEALREWISQRERNAAEAAPAA